MKTTGWFPRVHIDTAAVAAVGQAGGVLLTETIRAAGLDQRPSEALSPWRTPLAVHDPGKIILDLALSLVLGGDALSDPDHDARVDAPLVIDLDASLITAHSDKQQAAPTFKRGFGFHPLLAFADHGPAGTGECLVAHLRPGNAGSDTAADHITVTRAALAQLPDSNPRPGKKVLVRADGAGSTKAFTNWLTDHRVSYSVGFTLPLDTASLYKQIPDWVWSPALNAHVPR